MRTGAQAIPSRAALASASAALTTAPGRESVGTWSGTFGTGYLLEKNMGPGPGAPDVASGIDAPPITSQLSFRHTERGAWRRAGRGDNDLAHPHPSSDPYRLTERFE
ncbi:hypothetical protein GCM10009579_45460 [Streptomyces javensis]|uniref:Uncharacterized protein n=1 Tax=Streptomyces javensis TaxID=114698 RepID=A0ABN1X4L7_9ACTN